MTNEISFGLAFLAGLVSFLSPCVLPIVPGYVSFVTGLTLEQYGGAQAGAVRRHAALHSGLFVLGFSLVFVALGATATALGGWLFAALPVLQRVGGVLLIGFGLFLTGLLRPGFLGRDRHFRIGSKPAGRIGSLLTGVAFGAGWTPCIGPVLASMPATLGATDRARRGCVSDSGRDSARHGPVRRARRLHLPLRTIYQSGALKWRSGVT